MNSSIKNLDCYPLDHNVIITDDMSEFFQHYFKIYNKSEIGTVAKIKETLLLYNVNDDNCINNLFDIVSKILDICGTLGDWSVKTIAKKARDYFNLSEFYKYLLHQKEMVQKLNDYINCCLENVVYSNGQWQKQKALNSTENELFDISNLFKSRSYARIKDIYDRVMALNIMPYCSTFNKEELGLIVPVSGPGGVVKSQTWKYIAGPVGIEIMRPPSYIRQSDGFVYPTFLFFRDYHGKKNAICNTTLNTAVCSSNTDNCKISMLSEEFLSAFELLSSSSLNPVAFSTEYFQFSDLVLERIKLEFNMPMQQYNDPDTMGQITSKNRMCFDKTQKNNSTLPNKCKFNKMRWDYANPRHANFTVFDKCMSTIIAANYDKNETQAIQRFSNVYAETESFEILKNNLIDAYKVFFNMLNYYIYHQRSYIEKAIKKLQVYNSVFTKNLKDEDVEILISSMDNYLKNAIDQKITTYQNFITHVSATQTFLFNFIYNIVNKSSWNDVMNAFSRYSTSINTIDPQFIWYDNMSMIYVGTSLMDLYYIKRVFKQPKPLDTEMEVKEPWLQISYLGSSHIDNLCEILSKYFNYTQMTLSNNVDKLNHCSAINQRFDLIQELMRYNLMIQYKKQLAQYGKH